MEQTEEIQQWRIEYKDAQGNLKYEIHGFTILVEHDMAKPYVIEMARVSLVSQNLDQSFMVSDAQYIDTLKGE
jgi:hypothetical protein